MRTIFGVLTAAVLLQAPQSQPPTFRGSTDLVLIDTQVVSRDGMPVEGLKPEQFDVFIDGKRRAVAGVEFLRTVATPPGAGRRGRAGASGPAPATPPGEGRIIVLAIDEASFPVSAQAAAREAATRLADRVAPEDYLGMLSFPGQIRISPSRDHQQVRAAIPRIIGARVEFSARKYNISAAEASKLKSHDMDTAAIIRRECPPLDSVCPREVVQEGQAISDALEQQALTSIDGLHRVIDALTSVPGQKVLVVVSAGLPMTNRPGGRPNLDAETRRIAQRAAQANVRLYVFYMNVHFLNAFSAANRTRNYSIFEDISMFGLGLEKFSDIAGGSFSQIEVDADPFVDRALRETSAIYLVTVRAEPTERDGKEHFIRVEVKQRGVTVRYRKVVTIPTGS